MNFLQKIHSKKLTKVRKKPLGRVELIAIALGGMIGGGIFSILGVSVEIVGKGTPVAVALGGGLAWLAAYSYSKLAIYYKDEGATYSFFKKTFPNQRFAIASIGWLIVFGYISTLALYAFTFSTYFSTVFQFEKSWQIKLVSLGVISFFAAVNWISVNGMGKLEDIMVYTKVAILLVISGLFLKNGESAQNWASLGGSVSFNNIITVAALTFVAYEGFQLVIHAYEEAEDPQKNVPSAIHWSIVSTTFLYVILSLGALITIPKEILIRDKEFALAAGASDILGSVGYGIVIMGALLATSSAINGTLFGASRLMAVIANDGVFPKGLAKRENGHIPKRAICLMSILSFLFILTGGLQTIIEFGSITFIFVSLLMAIANFHIRDKTGASLWMSLIAIVGLLLAAGLILRYEAATDLKQVYYISGVFGLLLLCAGFFSKNFRAHS